MAGQTSTQQVTAPLLGDDKVKNAIIGDVIFNDSNGAKAFITGAQISVVKGAFKTLINVNFQTTGELGGGIDKTSFPFQLTHNGAVIYSGTAVPFEGPCRGGLHGHEGTDTTEAGIFDLADGVRIPVFTVNVYPC